MPCLTDQSEKTTKRKEKRKAKEKESEKGKAGTERKSEGKRIRREKERILSDRSVEKIQKK